MKSILLLGENFQIMNYGIGGKISGHVDSRGEIIDVNNTVSDNINGKYNYVLFFEYPIFYVKMNTFNFRKTIP